MLGRRRGRGSLCFGLGIVYAWDHAEGSGRLLRPENKADEGVWFQACGGISQTRLVLTLADEKVLFDRREEKPEDVTR